MGETRSPLQKEFTLKKSTLTNYKKDSNYKE